MWRSAQIQDDDEVVRLCMALHAEDPGVFPVPPEYMRRTLRELRETPARGRLMALELDRRVCGYALLTTFWSNELGGEGCLIDELYVEPEHRGRGHGSSLFAGLAARSDPSLPDYVALVLEVTPDNARAYRLYQRLGFVPGNRSLRRMLKVGGKA
jgi:ribosomal protein S18 acetylase RimI-like enzyme